MSRSLVDFFGKLTEKLSLVITCAPGDFWDRMRERFFAV